MQLFAEALEQFYHTGKAELAIERDDGLIQREDLSWYFTTPRDFPAHERGALQFARGKILDVGCGAGRHSLYLQKRGLPVTAIDVSPKIVELARARGVKDARVADVSKRLPFRNGEFDSVILFGNNLGLGGTPTKFRKMLRELHRVTSADARILATTRMPSTTNASHKGYLSKNLMRGRAVGQMRLRVLFNGRRGAWFELLLLAPTDLMLLASKEHWDVARVFPLENFETGYAVVLEKQK